MKCPSCGSTDINLETRTCRNCGDSIDGAVLLQEVEEATEAMEVAATEEQRQIAYETWEERVFRYHDNGFRIVTLIGFSGAGKTFLAHRLRRELSDDWTVLPPHADVIRGTDITIEWTQLVSKSPSPNPLPLRGRGQGEGGRRRVLADCDGEAFRLAIDALMNGRDIDPKMRRSIVITALASAYILMLPAAELIDRSKYKLTARLVERFDMIVKAILALQRIVQQSRSAREALHEGLKMEAIAEALQYEFRCEQPIHVLFAQADKMPSGCQHEDDPHMYALAHAKTLYRTIESHFTNFRFDFCCAFEGHNENHAYEVDYNLPSYGTVAAFNWIDRMLEATPRDRRRTAAAMKIRRLVDPAFRKASARVSG